DPDATFMHMKYDYYNNTGVFKPGYNVQMGVSSEYIRHIYISADANDMKTYMPFMDGYYDAYKTYPKIVDADAGYGCYNNYGYNSIHHIEQYLKYPGYEKEKEKKTKKNQFKSFQMKENENGEIICPAGHAFTLVSSRLDHRSMYPKTNQKYVNEHCGDCPLRSRCTKARKGRTLNRSRDMEKYHKEVRKNLESEKGKKIMIQRSIQAEGVFANLKQDYGYTRLRRRGESGVKEEIYLAAIGYNIRKYHNHKQRKKEEKLPKA
ncbi:transposase, partial [[Clostridium] innocuum]|nr:transposase [[Clostridium] innocuum]